MLAPSFWGPFQPWSKYAAKLSTTYPRSTTANRMIRMPRPKFSLVFALCTVAAICALLSWLRWEYESRVADQRCVDLFDRLSEKSGAFTMVVIEDEGWLTSRLFHVGYVEEMSVGPNRVDPKVCEKQMAALSQLRQLRRLTLFAVAPKGSPQNVPQHLRRLEIESVDVETVIAWLEVLSRAQTNRFELVIRGVPAWDSTRLNEGLRSKISKITVEDL